MSELPRIEDLPRVEEGYDPARVEQAFELFAERLRSLEEKLDRLAPALEAAAVASYDTVDEEWPLDRAPAAEPPDWVAAVPPPLPRPLVLPRIALEGAFVLAVALLAGLADLPAPWIVLAVALAWTIVALSEWSAAAQRARWRLEELPPDAAAPPPQDTDPWALPPVEATAVDVPDAFESRTVVTKLPEPQPEPGAKPRRRLFRRG